MAIVIKQATVQSTFDASTQTLRNVMIPDGRDIEWWRADLLNSGLILGDYTLDDAWKNYVAPMTTPPPGFGGVPSPSPLPSAKDYKPLLLGAVALFALIYILGDSK